MSKRFESLLRPHGPNKIARQRVLRNYCEEIREAALQSNDHDFCGLYQSGHGLADFQPHFPNSIGGYDGGNMLTANRKGHLCHQTGDLYVGHAADKLVAPADASKVILPFGNVSTLARS